MKHIFVSPHSDDVALSCGGQIISDAARKHDTLILNIFTSDSCDTYSEHDEREPKFRDSINEDRTAEDKAAWDELGVEAHYANLPEALLRRNFPFSIFPRREDPKMLGALRDVLISYARSYPEATFYFPAGFGNHIDHLACRNTAFDLLNEGLISRFILYEDIPYCWLRFIRVQHYRSFCRDIVFNRNSSAAAFRQEGANLFSYLSHGSTPFPRGKKLFSIVYAYLLANNFLRKLSSDPKLYDGNINLISLDDEIMARKCNLLFHYKSQIPMLFGQKPAEMLRHYHESLSREVTIEITKSRSKA